MHPYPAFAEKSDTKNVEFARNRGFGTLAMNGEHGPTVIQVPFLLSKDGSHADLHLARFNPIARAEPGDAVISVTGPDGYVSPDWYEVPDQVPTWNYIAVHLRGALAPLPIEALSDLIDRQSAFFEGRLVPKLPWTADKMSEGAKDKMMKAIRPYRLTITSVQGTWKLNQNKADAVRLKAAEKIGNGIGIDLNQLADHMRNP